MSSIHHTPAPSPSDPQARPTPGLDGAQLAHELNNLLDGSIRNLQLAIRELESLDSPDLASESEPIDTVQRLATAQKSLWLMAELITQLGDPGDLPTLTPQDTIGTMLDAITHANQVHQEQMEFHHIQLMTKLHPTLTDVPAGPVYTLLTNAIHNAIDAIALVGDRSHAHRIRVRIDRDADHQIVVMISDTGPGIDPAMFNHRGHLRVGLTTKTHGHGIGLGVCQQIANELNGTLTLATNHPTAETAGPTPGATLTLRYPNPNQS